MIASASLTVACIQNIPVYSFIKEDNCWFVSAGPANRLHQLPEGARAVLSTIAGGRKSIRLKMDTAWFEGADHLTLVELCPFPRGGAYYMMHTCNGRHLEKKMWVCDLALHVFGDMPECIYLSRLPEEPKVLNPVIQLDHLMQGA
jgi:hypothetical protein